MNIKDVPTAEGLRRRREGLLFLLSFKDYTGVSLTRHKTPCQEIEQWFSNIQETMREAALSELDAVETDLRNMGVQFPKRS